MRSFLEECGLVGSAGQAPVTYACSFAVSVLATGSFLHGEGGGAVTSAPDTPDLVAASDSGSSATDNLTNDTTPTFRVGLPPEAIAGNTVRVYRAGSTEIGSALLNGTDIANDFADVPVPSALSSGGHTITARVENAAGLSPASAGLAVTVDAVAPDAPTGIVVAPADQGLAPLQTDNTQPTFRISLPANAAAGDVATLQIDGVDDATAALDGTDISNGYVDIQSANALADDAFYEIAAYVTDVAGNEGAPIAAVLVEVGTAGVAAVTLNGINQYYAMDAGPGAIAAGQAFTRNLHWDPTGTVDGQVYTLFCISSWVPSTHEVIDFIIERLANNKIEARAYDNAGVLIGSVVSTSTVTNASGWTFIGVAMNGTSLRLRIDGAEESNQTAGTLADCQLGNKWWLGRGADPAAPNYTKGCLAEASAYEAALDYSDDDIAEMFYDSTAGLPRDIGADGSGPNPNVVEYLNKIYTAFHENGANADDYNVLGFIQPCEGPGAYSEAFSPITYTQPVYRSSSVGSRGNQAADNFDMTAPAGTVAGDLLVALAVSENEDWDTPATPGFTPVYHNDFGVIAVDVSYRIVQPGDSATLNFGIVAGGLRGFAFVYCIQTGTFNPTTPINVLQTNYDGTGADSVGAIPNITTVKPNSRGIALAVAQGSGRVDFGTIFSPDIYTVVQGIWPGGVSGRTGHISLPTPDAQGGSTFTFINSPTVGQDFGLLLAINPLET